MSYLGPIPPTSQLPPEMLARLSDDDLAWVDAWRERVHQALVDCCRWQKEQPRFTQWVGIAAALIERQLIVKGSAPAWEILLDARYGLRGQLKEHLASQAFSSLLDPLRGLPVEWLERVLEVALALLDAIHGPLLRTYVQSDDMPANASQERIVRKAMLHELHPSDLHRCAVPRAYWDTSPGWVWWTPENYPWPSCPPWEIWRREMDKTARLFNLPHPDDDSRMSTWLTANGIRSVLN